MVFSRVVSEGLGFLCMCYLVCMVYFMNVGIVLCYLVCMVYFMDFWYCVLLFGVCGVFYGLVIWKREYFVDNKKVKIGRASCRERV